MTYHARLNLIMLITVLGLVFFLYIVPQSNEVQLYTVSSLSAQAVQSIRITQKDTNIMLQKQESRWYLTEPINARADERKVAALLGILTATSNYRFPLIDLDRFDLDRPNIQLYINNEHFYFGGLTPVTNQQYVAAEDGIYSISPRYAVMLPSQVVEIVNTTLLAETEIPVSFAWNDVNIINHQGKWDISPENMTQLLSQEEFNHWVDLWQQAAVSDLMLDAEVSAISEALVSQKQLKIGLQNGQTILFNALEYESKLFFMRNDETIWYAYSDRVGQALLDPYYYINNTMTLQKN